MCIRDRRTGLSGTGYYSVLNHEGVTAMTTNHTPELDALLHQAMEADFQAEKARKLKNF